ncbi:hypothetical protein ACFY00_30875 [Kitasatospora sp. NPDC001540]|uniref:hypothetical protein n=1 Tax=Kitasatospora sp. NPDC001540 TaxID=3364014 RepID=UPI0036B67628
MEAEAPNPVKERRWLNQLPLAAVDLTKKCLEADLVRAAPRTMPVQVEVVDVVFEVLASEAAVGAAAEVLVQGLAEDLADLAFVLGEGEGGGGLVAGEAEVDVAGPREVRSLSGQHRLALYTSECFRLYSTVSGWSAAVLPRSCATERVPSDSVPGRF